MTVAAPTRSAGGARYHPLSCATREARAAWTARTRPRLSWAPWGWPSHRAGPGAGETQGRVGAVWNEPRPDLIQVNSPERNRNTEPW